MIGKNWFLRYCLNECAGGVIGHRGTIIKSLHRKTGASIHVGDILADCDVCLIEITASEVGLRLTTPSYQGGSLTLVEKRLTLLLWDFIHPCIIHSILLDMLLQVLVRQSIWVPIICFVFGEDGHVLHQLRQISGARVILHEPHLGTSDRIITISGTHDQIQAAQNLLHNFLFSFYPHR